MTDTPSPDGAAAPMITPVIMSGGSGTRLWPVSTEASPKQFHALASDQTMIQDTALRFPSGGTSRFNPPVIICNQRHRNLVQAQLTETGVTPAAIVLEPFGRNTAAVAVVAARMVAELHPGSLALLLPSDHVILYPEAFRNAVVGAAPAAAERLVTFGIEPTGPETGYGYIEQGEHLVDSVHAVARFVEKPDLETARSYLATGGYRWNAGIFLFSPAVMLAEMATYRDDIRAGAEASVDTARTEGVVTLLDAEAFRLCPSESIDVAVMEQTAVAAVAPVSAGWSDVGSWSELWRVEAQTDADNYVHGDALALDTTGSLIWTEGPTLGVVGMTDVLVVAANDAVLVLPRSRAQDVKRLVAALQARTKEAEGVAPATPTLVGG